MKKPMYLAALCLAVTSLSAPAALAQEAGPGGEDRCTGTPFENYIPEVNGCVTTEGQPFPGEVTVFDADTREPLGTLEELVGSGTTTPGADGPATEEYGTTTEQYGTSTQGPSATTTPTATTTTTTTATATGLPATGGPAILPAAALLLAAGLVGLRMSRRP